MGAERWHREYQKQEAISIPKVRDKRGWWWYLSPGANKTEDTMETRNHGKETVTNEMLSEGEKYPVFSLRNTFQYLTKSFPLAVQVHSETSWFGSLGKHSPQVSVPCDTENRSRSSDLSSLAFNLLFCKAYLGEWRQDSTLKTPGMWCGFNIILILFQVSVYLGIGYYAL